MQTVAANAREMFRAGDDEVSPAKKSEALLLLLPSLP
jgi:hypothetical protein